MNEWVGIRNPIQVLDSGLLTKHKAEDFALLSDIIHNHVLPSYKIYIYCYFFSLQQQRGERIELNVPVWYSETIN